jgi:hypothetical protein
MRRSASEIIRELEGRIARLEGRIASTTIKGGEPDKLGGVDHKAVKTSWSSVKDLLSDVQEIYNEEYYSRRDETYKRPEDTGFDFEDRWDELGIDNAIFFYTLSENGENAGMEPYLIADRDDLVKALLETDKGFKSAYEKLIRKYLESKLR